MGVPQKRERVFFIALRKDLAGKYLERKDFFTISPKIEMEFKEKEIPFKSVDSGKYGKKVTIEGILQIFEKILPGQCVADAYEKIYKKRKYFNYTKIDQNKPVKTITAGDGGEFRSESPFLLHDEDLIFAGSFPTDYNFLKNRVKYLIGMSVPPVMVANIASNIREQWKEVFE
jgi:DNA (cytosine-5)-methyltransferase 1